MNKILKMKSAMVAIGIIVLSFSVMADTNWFTFNLVSEKSNHFQKVFRLNQQKKVGDCVVYAGTEIILYANGRMIIKGKAKSYEGGDELCTYEIELKSAAGDREFFTGHHGIDPDDD
ncbi:secreted protein [Candidatus Thiomargarita nelsonii]|uniref:Secreted protein n=1 Tax=Candidatus Thiomargarita nelsonii TaxID=1003181 RepID=A0A176S2D9_9GAMM|nr:secreted protein [Candidatus Thiomargarita nelsonii]